MKLLVLSDSHTRFEKLIDIVKKENPDVILGAGDHSKDFIELSYVFEKIPFYIVKGNCDYFDMETPGILEFKLNNKNIYLTHGHLFGVKISYVNLLNEALKKNADIVVFGHTHIPDKYSEKGVTLFNPGAVKDGNYGVIILDEQPSFFHKAYNE